jgi:chaperonin GroES
MRDLVLVRRDEATGVLPSGILIPQDWAKIPRVGTVLAVGPGKLDENGARIPITNIPIGSRVIIDYHKGINVDRELGGSLHTTGTHYMLVPADAVLALQK